MCCFHTLCDKNSSRMMLRRSEHKTEIKLLLIWKSSHTHAYLISILISHSWKQIWYLNYLYWYQVADIHFRNSLFAPLPNTSSNQKYHHQATQCTQWTQLNVTTRLMILLLTARDYKVKTNIMVGTLRVPPRCRIKVTVRVGNIRGFLKHKNSSGRSDKSR